MRVLRSLFGLGLFLSAETLRAQEDELPSHLADVKPWEKDAAGNVIHHPQSSGIVNPTDSSTWTHLPPVPTQGQPATYGIWVLGPNREFLMAPTLYVFKNPAGENVRVPDHLVNEINGKMTAKWTDASGKVVESTEMVGDIGHPTLISEIPGDADMRARAGGEYRLAFENGKLHIEINNLSGRFSTNEYKKFEAHTEDLEKARDVFAKIYKIPRQRVIISTFMGERIFPIAERFPASFKTIFTCGDFGHQMQVNEAVRKGPLKRRRAGPHKPRATPR